jgi:hypothetical protein
LSHPGEGAVRAIGEPARATPGNGAALAAFLASGIGALALGLIVILNETRLFVAPALYGPAGGVSGRTTIATAVWLIAWGVLHQRWRDRHLESSGIPALTLVLIALGLLFCFPPVWTLL